VIPVWQGIANKWDCDEMGHMNVRIYVEKALEGLGVFAAQIGMPNAYKPNSPSTLIPADQHIRYIREVHAGNPVSMTACVLEVGECDAVIYQDMRHGDGRCAAAFRTRIVHANAKTCAPFPWSTRSRAALEALIDTPPDETAPRSIDPKQAPLASTETNMSAVDKVRPPMVGMGAISPQHCDVFGRMVHSWFIGRISDSVPNLLYEWRQKIANNPDGKPAGGAVLEYRLVYRRWPQAGDVYQVHTSFGGEFGKAHALNHWVMDPLSGKAWVTCQAVAVTFDLETRKVIPPKPEHMDLLKQLAPQGLGF